MEAALQQLQAKVDGIERDYMSRVETLSKQLNERFPPLEQKFIELTSEVKDHIDAFKKLDQHVTKLAELSKPSIEEPHKLVASESDCGKWWQVVEGRRNARAGLQIWTELDLGFHHALLPSGAAV